MGILKKIIGLLILIGSIYLVMFLITYFFILPNHTEREAREKFVAHISPQLNDSEVKNLETSVTAFGLAPSLVVFDYTTESPEQLSFVSNPQDGFSWNRVNTIIKDVCAWVSEGSDVKEDLIMFEKIYVAPDVSKMKSYLCFNTSSKKAVFLEK